MPDEVLAHDFVDYVVVDEGEETLKELVAGRAVRDILGLCFKENQKIIKNSPRPLIKELDGIPPPAYHLLPMHKYFPTVGAYKRLPVMTIFATRGCPGRCTFCHRSFKGMVRKRSARNIINEIQILQRDYGIKGITFYDDTFTLFKDVVREFCNILIEERIDIDWSCFTRVDHINEELLLLMKKAGCFQILFGVESGDEGILKNINKKISLKQAEEAVKAARRVGIETRASFLIGNQGETAETLARTINFAIKLDPDIAQFNITTAYPGTELFNWAKEKGYIKTFNWDDYSLSNVVWELPELNRNELQRYYLLAHRRFFVRPKMILRRLWNMRNWASLARDFKASLALFGFFLGKK
jgi:radical SAM superfamily enzyme YgiQ (UPF0313 family)